MKGLFYFFLGVFCTVIFFSIYSVNDEMKEFEVFPEAVVEPEIEENIQYFDISTVKGNIQLFTTMSKDSVMKLMGKPRETDVYQVGEIVHEEWGYRGRNRYINEFTIHFRNGKLIQFMQDRE